MIRARIVIAALLLFSLGCGRLKSDSVVKECVLPGDQVGTLLGKWRYPPVPIAFQQGAFSAGEMSAIIAAADTWNTFYASSIGQGRTIDYGTSASPRVSSVPRPASGSLCSGGIVSGNGYTGQVVIYKNGTWPFVSSPNAMALTSHCRTAGTPLPYYYMAILDLNYENFFVSGKRIPDLQSIILHEFGHVVGLDHSCENSGGTGMPNCNATNLNIDYFQALMYPTFGFLPDGSGQQKRSLNSNDEGRANCLYMSL